MKATCSSTDCDRSVLARGLCSRHYDRARKRGELDAHPTLPKVPFTRTCSVDGCHKPHYGRGLCQACYTRQRRRGTVEFLEKQPSVGFLTHDGYRRIYATGHPLASPDGRVFEHRVVAYAKYGSGEQRCNWCATTLTWDTAHVDHLDGARLHNAPDNLVLACGSCNTRRSLAGNPVDFKPPRRTA